MVRSGVSVELKAKQVVVDKFEITSPVRFHEKNIEIDVEVSCSSGTYIRALARDLGADLEVGGHLIALRRTQVGPFSVEAAQSIEQIGADSAKIISSIDAVTSFMNVIHLDEAATTKLRNGIPLRQALVGIAAAVCGKELVAIVEAKDKDFVRSLVVFPKDSND